MRWIVREGTRRGEGRYLERSVIRVGSPVPTVRDCYVTSDMLDPSWDFHAFPTQTGAERAAQRHGGRVVRLLSHEEAKRKAQAQALRSAAKQLREELDESLLHAKAEENERGTSELGFFDGEVSGIELACKSLGIVADELWPARERRAK